MPEMNQKFRTETRHKRYRDTVLNLGSKWKEKQKEADQQLREGEWSWKIATANVWNEIVKDAGGEGDELAPFFMSVRANWRQTGSLAELSVSQ